MTAAFGGDYGSVNAPPGVIGVTKLDINQHNFLFGPQVRVLKKPRLSVTLHGLFGASKGNADPDFRVVDGEAVRFTVKETKFAASVGAALDINLTERLAWRVLQPVYFPTRFGGDWQSNFRVSTGLVWRCCGLPATQN